MYLKIIRVKNKTLALGINKESSRGFRVWWFISKRENGFFPFYATTNYFQAIKKLVN